MHSLSFRYVRQSNGLAIPPPPPPGVDSLEEKSAIRGRPSNPFVFLYGAVNGLESYMHNLSFWYVRQSNGLAIPPPPTPPGVGRQFIPRTVPRLPDLPQDC